MTRSSPQSSLNWLRNQNWLSGWKSGDTSKRVRALAMAELKNFFGFDSHLDTEDRHVLENVIFPYFLNDDSYRNVLFVGCSWCTRAYNARFETRKNYWTIDIETWKRRYGAKQHIVGPLQDVDRHFRPGQLDLIICNGVYGWGLNERYDIEEAFTACRQALRENGVLIIGWDEANNPYPLSMWECLSAFRPFVFPPLETAEFVTATCYRHTYSFYRRAEGETDRIQTEGA